MKKNIKRVVVAISVLVLVLLAVITVVRMTSRFPKSVERRISKSLSDDGRVVEIAGLSFSWTHLCLRLDSVNIFATDNEHRVAVAIGNANLRLRPCSLIPGVKWLSQVKIESLDFDPNGISALSAGSGDSGGKLEIGPLNFYINKAVGMGIEARSIYGTLTVDSDGVDISNFSILFSNRGHREQILRGDIFVESNSSALEVNLSGEFDFSKAVPVLRMLGNEGIALELEKFEFPTIPPHIEVLLYCAPEQKINSLDISIQSGPMRYCGVRLSEMSALVRVAGKETWEKVEIDPLELKRPEGVATGSLCIDLAQETIAFDCVSAIDPIALATMVRLVERDNLQDIEIEGPADIRCNGILGLGESEETRTKVHFSASAQGITAKGVRFSDVASSGSIDGNIIDIPRITSEVLGGSLEVAIKVDSPNEDNPADRRVAFVIDLQNALLFRIPIFAGLTDLLAKYIPGVNFLVDQDNAQVRATLEGGRWNVSKFSISGGAFTIDGAGTALADGSDIDIVARVRLMNKRTWLGRIVQRLLSPLSGLLGVRGTGSLESPRWIMAPFSKLAN